ncbi:MAG: type II toxin-antitoxin system VapC family toxin, partial [Chthoniobacterales bacterium]
AEWGSALLWRWEFRNAMVGYIRRGSLTATVAGQLCGKAQATLSGREFSSSPQAVFELVSKSSCTAYDCEFVAVAREQGVPLVTMDKQVLREFPHLATSLPDFLAH